jgi:hypothetical protein
MSKTGKQYAYGVESSISAINLANFSGESKLTIYLRRQSKLQQILDSVIFSSIYMKAWDRQTGAFSITIYISIFISSNSQILRLLRKWHLSIRPLLSSSKRLCQPPHQLWRLTLRIMSRASGAGRKLERDEHYAFMPFHSMWSLHPTNANSNDRASWSTPHLPRM